MRDEQEILERIRAAVPCAPRAGSLLVGIGDDAAVLRSPSATREDWVLTCDSFLENFHFLARVHSPEAVGYKSLARATSDLAAMGARPRYFLLALALPSHRTGKWLDRFLRGMSAAARSFGLFLAGGDTSRNATVAISITVLGTIAPGRAVTRSGARPGDVLYVSGTLGRAQLGLELILRGLHRHPRWKRLLATHLRPPLRLALGEWLARNRLASAMIDTSDGFSSDLAHLCDASGLGARISLNRLPKVLIPRELRARGLAPDELALHGGEDYELLFTVPRHRAKKIPASFAAVPLSACGEITREKKILLVGAAGRTTPLPRGGWDHFRSRQQKRRLSKL